MGKDDQKKLGTLTQGELEEIADDYEKDLIALLDITGEREDEGISHKTRKQLLEAGAQPLSETQYKGYLRIEIPGKGKALYKTHDTKNAEEPTTKYHFVRYLNENNEPQ